MHSPETPTPMLSAPRVKHPPVDRLNAIGLPRTSLVPVVFRDKRRKASFHRGRKDCCVHGECGSRSRESGSGIGAARYVATTSPAPSLHTMQRRGKGGGEEEVRLKDETGTLLGSAPVEETRWRPPKLEQLTGGTFRKQEARRVVWKDFASNPLVVESER